MVIVALAHDIGKIEKSDIASISEEVAKVTDHPYLSGMIIKERFPEYKDIDELVSIVQEHHLPIDKGASICAAALKAADQKARREEIKRWFIRTYGKEAKSPDPYLNLTVGNESGQRTQTGDKQDNNGVEPIATAVYIGESDDETETDGYDEELSERTIVEMPVILEDDQRQLADQERKQAKQTTTAKPSETKSRFGETKTPKYQSNDYRTLEFDLTSCEEIILDRLRTEPIVIERIGENVFIPALNIVSIPCDDCLLVSFQRVTGLIGGLFEGDRERGEIEFGAMTRYAINEWRKRNIVLFMGEGYATRKYEYLYNGEQRKVINAIPFSIDALELSAGDLLERAKQHPLFSLIGDLRMTKG